jgi:hypothetical protein
MMRSLLFAVVTSSLAATSLAHADAEPATSPASQAPTTTSSQEGTSARGHGLTFEANIASPLVHRC